MQFYDKQENKYGYISIGIALTTSVVLLCGSYILWKYKNGEWLSMNGYKAREGDAVNGYTNNQGASSSAEQEKGNCN